MASASAGPWWRCVACLCVFLDESDGETGNVESAALVLFGSLWRSSDIQCDLLKDFRTDVWVLRVCRGREVIAVERAPGIGAAAGAAQRLRVHFSNEASFL